MVTRDTDLLSGEHWDYIEDRMLDPEDAIKCGVRTSKGHLTFDYGEYRKAKNLTNNGPAYWAVPKNVPHSRLWQEERVAQMPVGWRDFLVITEGEFDALAVIQTGHDRVVSLPDGASCVNAIHDGTAIKPWISKYRSILILTDNDRAGREAKEKLVAELGVEFCYEVVWPPRCKDANQVLQKYDRDFLAALIENRKPIGGSSCVPFSHITNTPPKTLNPPNIPGIKDLIRIGVPNFAVVGAHANVGKSALSQMLLFELLAANPGTKCSIFNGEGFAQIMKGRLQRFCQSRGLDVDEWMGERVFQMLLSEDGMPTFPWLLNQIERHALDHDIDIILIDPWNEIIPQRDLRDSKTEWTAQSIIEMKTICRKLEVCLFVGHHVTKQSALDAMPTMDQLSDSQHWMHKTDHVLMMHRPNKGITNDYCEINVSRVKERGLLGDLGTVKLMYNDMDFSFEECGVVFSADN